MLKHGYPFAGLPAEYNSRNGSGVATRSLGEYAGIYTLAVF